MSKIGNGANRMKNAREAYVEQLAHGRGKNETLFVDQINRIFVI